MSLGTTTLNATIAALHGPHTGVTVEDIIRKAKVHQVTGRGTVGQTLRARVRLPLEWSASRAAAARQRTPVALPGVRGRGRGQRVLETG